MHPLLSEAHLHPRKVFFFCANLHSSSRDKTRLGNPCDGRAEVWLVAEGRAISKVCRTCAKRDLPQLQGGDPASDWHEAPIHHDDPSMPDQWKERE